MTTHHNVSPQQQETGRAIIWRSIWKVLTATDHKVIGVRYVVTAAMFFLLAGGEAILMRIQLAQPSNGFADPEIYNQWLTMHGTLMMFFFATPVLFGFGNYLLPLLLGARRLSFPRLNALCYWIFLFAGLFLYSTATLGYAAGSGWFAYLPLSTRVYSPERDLDFWLLAILALSVSTVGTNINFTVTVLKRRAAGMRFRRLPPFAWAVLVSAVVMLVSVPVLFGGVLMLLLERMLGLTMYTQSAGGDPLLWQHLFWFYSHALVFVIFILASGIISEIVQTFARHKLVGYQALVAVMIGMGMLGLAGWGHYLVDGDSIGRNTLFSATSLILIVPLALLVAIWFTTLLVGKPQLRLPLMWVLGSFIVFGTGLLVGVALPLGLFGISIDNSYVTVAHFHYMLLGGAVMPAFAGLYYWLPKMTGRSLHQRLGYIQFWLFFLAIHATYLPMYVLGWLGMPRWHYTYAAGQQWGELNLIVSLATGGIALSIILFFMNVVYSLLRGSAAPADPWGGATLTWQTTSPPSRHNFDDVVQISGPTPTWDAAPEMRDGYRVPDFEPPDSILPLLGALTLMGGVVSILLAALWMVGACFLVMALIIGLWAWGGTAAADVQNDPDRYPVIAAKSDVWWGTLLMSLVLAEGLIVIVGSYIYLAIGENWPPDNLMPVQHWMHVMAVLLLVAIGGVLWRIGSTDRFQVHLAVAVLFAAVLIGILIYGTAWTPLPPAFNAYTSLVMIIRWVFGAYLALGGLLLLWALLAQERGSAAAVYWQVIGAVGVLSLITLILI